ncbi:helix-turn-helix domain-containing protein [Sphingomonas psychrotolerans]|uniref:Helix-turn-helix domain-containing protein n=1 Tax=Sphingomonas psychrotolerans TaxID=1327635 RepID=A0ABU3N2X7_9SPHN|nr:helix-turn-helix domain-containing protein [Sphingomonas psychrotolerans]MDT8758753.1 helix-turn-helix domain-containing protein [Sphingomonas psychrotolerans]
MRDMPSRLSGNLSPITLRIADACRITGIGRSKFYELIKAGEIEVIKIGSITLVPMSGIQVLLARGGAGSAERSKGNLADAMHPFLANAILTGSIAGIPESVRRDLMSKDQGTRTKAEDSIVGRMIAALYDAQD